MYFLDFCLMYILLHNDLILIIHQQLKFYFFAHIILNLIKFNKI